MFKSLMLVVSLILSGVSFSEEDPYDKLDWKIGPTSQKIAGKAKIVVPNGYAFLGVRDTDEYLRLSHNTPSGDRHLFTEINGLYEAYFSFDAIGYVKDDEELDAESLLKFTIENQNAANKERVKKGWQALTVLGWEFEPRYDRASNLLEWAFLIRDERDDANIVNYETRILGKDGVMKVVLVTNPEDLHIAVLDFKKKIKGFEYNPGASYSEYSEGDKVAEYGLAALIAGGAAAAASKKGFWALIVDFLLQLKNL